MNRVIVGLGIAAALASAAWAQDSTVQPQTSLPNMNGQKSDAAPGDRARMRMQMRQLGAVSERFMGVIQAVSPKGDSLVILRGDTGAKVTVKPAADAHIIKDQNLGAKLSDFQVGDYAAVAGNIKEGVVEAKLLATSSEQSKTLRTELGKTIVIGKVLSVDPDTASIKVRRVDGQEQTITADENSSFKRGRDESVTMADIKAGDQIGARGTLKDGAFTITRLNLMPAGMMMMGGGRAGNGEQQHRGSDADNAPPQ